MTSFGNVEHTTLGEPRSSEEHHATNLCLGDFHTLPDFGLPRGMTARQLVLTLFSLLMCWLASIYNSTDYYMRCRLGNLYNLCTL